MASYKVIYSVKHSFYRNNAFVRSSDSTFYDCEDKAIDAVKFIARIYNGEFRFDKNPLFVYAMYKENEFTVIVSIDTHLLF